MFRNVGQTVGRIDRGFDGRLGVKRFACDPQDVQELLELNVIHDRDACIIHIRSEGKHGI